MCAARHDLDLEQACAWAVELTYDRIPPEVILRAKAQVLSCLAAVHAGLGVAPSGTWKPSLDAGPPFPIDPDIGLDANLLALAQLVSLLDYDEVILGGHVSQSSVLIALLHAFCSGLSGAEALRIVVATNEIAGRVGIACALGRYRGQTALFVHQAGTVVAKALSLGLSAAEMARALRLAFSFDLEIDGDAFLASDAKVLSASVPMSHSLHCLAQAQHGYDGRWDYGSSRSRWARRHALFPIRGLFEDLGHLWYTNGLSIKRYPACAYMCAAIEAAETLRYQHGLSAGDVQHIEVGANLLQYLCDVKTHRHFLSAAPRLATKPFNTAFALAALFVHGRFDREAYASDAHWPLLRAFIERVEVRLDRDFAVTSLTSALPLGFALHRLPRLHAHCFIQASLLMTLGWRGYLSRLPQIFRTSLGYHRGARGRDDPRPMPLNKHLGADVVIRTHDGGAYRCRLETHRGFAQAALDGTAQLTLAEEKFVAAVSEHVGRPEAKRRGRMLLALDAVGGCGAGLSRSA